MTARASRAAAESAPIPRLPRTAATVLWALLLAELLAMIAVQIAAGSQAFGETTANGPGVLTPLYVAVGLTFGVVGALLAQRRPDVAIGWLLWLAGSMIGLGLVAFGYADLSVTAFAGSLPGTTLLAWASAWLPGPALGILILYLPLVFPTGRPLSPRWHAVEVMVRVLIASIALETILRPGPLAGFPTIENPTQVSVPALAGLLQVTSGPLLVPAAILALAAAVVRYRRGDVIERLQLRWFGSAVAVVILMVVGATLLPPPASNICWALMFVALVLVAVAIGVAILRYRLYDLDRLISRTVGWGLSTAVILLVFAAALAVLQTLLAGFTQGATVAVAGSTLAALAAFQPFRRRVQTVVDRRFDRARYDGIRTATAFSDRLRGEFDLDAVRGELVATTATTLRPAEVGVWLRTRGLQGGREAMR